MRAWLASVLPLAIATGAEAFYNQIDTIILRMYDLPSGVGIYRIAINLSSQVVFLLSIVNAATGPLLARAHAAGQHEELMRIAKLAARISLVGAVSVAVLFLFFGQAILRIAFGNDFVPAYWPLMILTCGQIVMAGAGAVALILNMTGHERDVAWTFALSIAVNMMVSFLLIPHFGGIGAALASAIGIIVWNLVLIRQVHRRVGFYPTFI